LGFVQVKVVGLEGVPAPEAVSAVVPSVSVKVVVPEELLAVISLPFRSVALPESEAD
jgi:hypothetical protein